MTDRLHRIWSIPVEQLVLAAEACVWLSFTRLCLVVLPFRWIFSLAEIISIQLPGGVVGRNRDLTELKGVRLAIRRAVVFLPWESRCLVQVIAARWMLYLRCLPSEMTIGVRGPKFEAHAWLTSLGYPVSGVRESEGFKIISKSE